MSELRTTNQGPGNCGTTKGVEKIVDESDLVLQSQHFLTIVIASYDSFKLFSKIFLNS